MMLSNLPQIDKADAILALRPNAQFRLQGDVLTWTDPKLTEPTAEEIQKKYDELVAAQPLNELRMVRNIKLTETDWVVIKEREEGGTVKNFADWKEYRQKLRDITNGVDSIAKIDEKLKQDKDGKLVNFPTAPSE